MHPEVFRHANCNGTSFKAVWWSISEKIYLALKHYFPLYLQGQTQHTLRFSAMQITMVQVSKLYMMIHFSLHFLIYKTHLGLKHHFPLYLQGQTQHTLRFSGMPITMVQVSKLYDDPFLRKHILGLKHYFPLYLQGQTQHTLRFSGMPITMVQVSKLYDDPFLRKQKTHLGLNSAWGFHFPLYLWGKTHFSQNSVFTPSAYPEVFRHANHNGTSFKAVWWSIYEKTHFSLKHHFPLYLQGQTQHTLRLSGMPITMVQVSKLYDDPFQRKHILGLKHHFPLYLEGQTQCTLRFSGMPIAMVQVSKLYDDPFLRKYIWG